LALDYSRNHHPHLVHRERLQNDSKIQLRAPEKPLFFAAIGGSRDKAIGTTPALHSTHFLKKPFAYTKHFDQLRGISHLT
jgi:hypothetical protein